MSLPMLPYYSGRSTKGNRIYHSIEHSKRKYGLIIKHLRILGVRKFCPCCSKTKPLSDFYLSRKTNYPESYCKSCNTVKGRQYPSRKHYQKKHAIKLRQKTLSIISNNNPKCVRCGCDDVRFLEINHKNGGGAKDYQDFINRGKNFNHEIAHGRRKTDDLELLCRPCNHIHYLEMKYGEKIPLRVVWEKPIEVMCR